MHSIQPIVQEPKIDYVYPGKLITLLPTAASKETGFQLLVEEQIWENGTKRDLPVDGKKVLMTTNFQRDGCPCERPKRKLKIIRQPAGYSFVSTPHCELVPKGSDWWIRDLKSVKGTFVNGSKLSENEEKKLKDLDIISLGVSHMDPKILDLFRLDSDDDEDDDDEYCKKGALRIVYRYKAPCGTRTHNDPPRAINCEFVELKEEQSLNLAKLKYKYDLLESVLENELLVFNILGKLSVPDLKNARLVCKKWKNQSSKWFYSCTRVDVPGLDCAHWSFLKDNYDSYFKGQKIERVSLDLNEKSTPRTFDQSFLPNQEMHWNVKEQLYLGNVHWFFSNFGRGIKSLKLDLKIQGENWSLFFKILEELSSVKDLQLQLSIMSRLSHNDMAEACKFPEEMPKIRSVKSLSILIKDRFGMMGELRNFRLKFEPLLVGLLRIFPSVEKLTLPDPKLLRSMEIFLNIIKDNAILIPRVKDLAITFDRDFVWDKTIEILPEIPFVNKLRSLELYNLSDGPNNRNHMMNLLKKTAPYLEILTLGLRKSNTFINSLMDERGGLPAFPKLWRLNILSTIGLNCLRELDNYPGVNYDTVFPKLKSLKFGGMLNSRLTNCYLEHFLRMENDPCRTVVEFELDITSAVQLEPDGLRQTVAEKFPNLAVTRIKFLFKTNACNDNDERISDNNSGKEYSDSENDSDLDLEDYDYIDYHHGYDDDAFENEDGDEELDYDAEDEDYVFFGW